MSILRALEKKRREISFTGNMLKIIAMFTMLLDHIAVMLIQNGKLYGYDAALYQNAITLPEAKNWLIVYRIFRMCGRIAFPLFAFLIVEGFRKTSNLFKYINRLIILAVISEVPFDLVIFNKPICFDVQNVIFTYLIGIFMLSAIKLTKDFPIIVHMILSVVAGVICYYMKTDYAIEGIILMFIFYIFRHDLNIKCLLSIIVTFVCSLRPNYGTAIFAIPFIYFYDGHRGYIDIKKIPYIFYPVHMLVLYAIVYFSYIH